MNTPTTAVTAEAKRREQLDQIATCAALSSTATDTTNYIRHLNAENRLRAKAAPITCAEECRIAAVACSKAMVYGQDSGEVK